MDNVFYLTYDLPISYKSVKLYPVTVQDYLMFNVYAQCLVIDKNSIPDVKIISMSDLEYIYYATQENAEKQPYLLWFDRLLSLCLKDEKSFEKIEQSIERYYTDKNGKAFFKIGNETYDSYDFGKLKEIIAEQNMLELPDFSTSKEVRDSLEEARAYKSRMSSGTVSFEDYLVSMSVATGWKLEDIYSMTIRKFTKSIKRMDNLIHYKIFLNASLTGMTDFKDKSFIKHWLSNIDDENKYGDVTMDMDEVQSTVSMESARNSAKKRIESAN